MDEDKEKILKYWALANANHNSNSHRQNQESNPVPVQNPTEENDDDFKDLEQKIQENTSNLIRSLRLKLSNVTETSHAEILALKKRLHDSEIRNSELSQENSKLREEKRRCELSSEMAQVSASILEGQLEEMTRKNTELEKTLEEKTTENSALQFLLDETEAKIQKLKDSLLEPISLTPSVKVLEEQSLQKISTSSIAPQSFEAQEIYNCMHIRIKPLAELMEISENIQISIDAENMNENENENSNLISNVQNTQEEAPNLSELPQQIFNRENVEEKDEEENYRKFLCKNPCASQVSKPKESKENEKGVHKQSESPRIELQASAGASSSPRKSKRTQIETKDKSKQSKEVEPLKKRSRSFSGASCSSTSTSAKSSSTIESVLNIPEIYRINYGFTNNWELENCSHARDFWYDSEHSNISKFLIRFYDDEEYQREKLLHVKQQKNQEEPKIKYEKLRHMEKQFESLSKKMESGCGTGFRLFLDVRDFEIFRSKIPHFFKDFGKFVTHFSFGRRLFSFDEVSASQLLNFILEKFPNLEYLAINDGMLKKTDQPLKIVSDKKLEKLKTIRLMTIGYKIYTSLIIELLLHAPALEQIYGIPLHCLSEIKLYFEVAENSNSNSNSNLALFCKKQGDKVSMDFIKNVTVIRNIYDEVTPSGSESNPNTFLADISTLQHLNPPLEVVDVRTYFVRDPPMRQTCAEKWSEILNSIKTHVKSLKIEPFQMTNFPRLENLHTLHFDIDSRSPWIKTSFGYFPPNFDLAYKFPQLKVVEIGLNEKSSQFLKRDDKTYQNLFHTHFSLDVFRPNHTFDQVERLNLTNFAPPTCILNFNQLFPRITILQLTLETTKMSSVLPLVYKFWPGLKQLILAVTFSSKANFNLDSAFTGMHFAGCRRLNQQIQDKDLCLDLDKKSIEETMKTHKIKSSIRNLRDLTLLKMVLNMQETSRGNKIGDCLMTPVSAIYGFGRDQMPGLKMVVGFDERMTTTDKKAVKNLLEPMKSYLIIDD